MPEAAPVTRTARPSNRLTAPPPPSRRSPDGSCRPMLACSKTPMPVWPSPGQLTTRAIALWSTTLNAARPRTASDRADAPGAVAGAAPAVDIHRPCRRGDGAAPGAGLREAAALEHGPAVSVAHDVQQLVEGRRHGCQVRSHVRSSAVRLTCMVPSDSTTSTRSGPTASCSRSLRSAPDARRVRGRARAGCSGHRRCGRSLPGGPARPGPGARRTRRAGGPRRRPCHTSSLRARTCSTERSAACSSRWPSR